MADKTPGNITPGVASDDSKVHATQADNSLSRSHTERGISRLQGTTPTYSDSKTYALNDLVTESGVVYRNIIAVTVAEAFDSAKWQSISSTTHESKWKEPVKAASIANIDLSTGTELTIDGVSTSAGDRVLVKNQTLPQQNGIYIVNVLAWTRAPDMDEAVEFDSSIVWVSEGTANFDTCWYESLTVSTIGDVVFFEKVSSLEVVFRTDNQIITNKTIALGVNTVSGTKAEFDTALTDDFFAFLNESNTYGLGLIQDFKMGELINANNIGIGTDEMTGFELHISDASASGIAQFRMTGFGGTVTQNMGQEFDWQYRRSTSGIAIMDIQVKPLDDGSNSNVQMRFGLESGSNGFNNVVFFDSNGTIVQSQIGSSNSSTYFNRNGGNFGIAKRNPLFTLDVNGEVRVADDLVMDSGGVRATGTVTMGGNIVLNVFATGTATLDTVTGATHSTGTITHPGEITIGDTIRIGDIIFVAATNNSGNNFNVTGDAAADQASLILKINTTSTTVQASVISTSQILITAITLNATTGNEIIFIVTGTSMSVSGSGTLENGVNVTDNLKINVQQYSPVTNPLLVIPNEGEFDVSGTNNDAAEALSDAINADNRTNSTFSSAFTGAEVTITTEVLGLAGNSVSMSEVGGSITISGATLTGGLEGDTVTLYENLIYTAVGAPTSNHTQFDASGLLAATASNLATAINNDGRQGTPTNDQIFATPLNNVTTISARVAGTPGNNIDLASSNVINLPVSGSTLGSVDFGVNPLVLRIATGTLDTNRTVSFPPISADSTIALLGQITTSFAYPLSDETTALTTGVKYTTEPSPYDMILDESITGLTTAGTGGAQATGTVTCGAVVDGNTLTVNGLQYEAVSSSPTSEQFIRDVEPFTTAFNLAAAITADTRVGVTEPSIDQTATAIATNIVTITASFGVDGNSVGLTAVGGTMTPSGATLTGGSGTVFTVDILKESGENTDVFSTIFTNYKPTIDPDQFTSTTATTPSVLTTTTWEKGRRLQLEITVLDTGAAARGVKATLVTRKI